MESGCNRGLLGNTGRRGGCNATQDAQDAQDAKTTSPTPGRNDDASNAGNIFADVEGMVEERIWVGIWGLGREVGVGGTWVVGELPGKKIVVGMTW